MNLRFAAAGLIAAASLILVMTGCESNSRAKAIMQQERCLDCHTIKGEGGAVGPNLTTVGSRRTRDYLVQQIKDPKSHNPDTAMPSPSRPTLIASSRVLVRAATRTASFHDVNSSVSASRQPSRPPT